MLRAADQRVTDVYTKKYLTPGGERQWLGWGKDRFTPGDQPRVFPVADVPVGVAICYEDLVFATARELQGAQWIALTSNDSWLGAAGMHFHLRAARRLAIEQGRWVARATVNGMSTFIDPLGRLYPGERLTDGAQGQAWILPVPLRKLQLPQTLFRPILLIACAVGILRPLNAAPRRRSPASE
jgi:apolipoprotein N-acyltransferase